MKKAVFLFLIIYQLVSYTSSSAQYVIPLSYLRLDSVSTLGEVLGIKEDTGNYYLYDYHHVLTLNKSTETIDTILQTNVFIKDFIIDTAGTIGVLFNHKIMFWQNNSWIDFAIENTYDAKKCFVNGNNEFFFHCSTDSISKYANGIWSKFKLNFSDGNEHIGVFVAGVNNECLVLSLNGSLRNIYQIAGGIATLMHNVPFWIDWENFPSIDQNANVWFVENNVLKHKNLSGIIEISYTPSAGTIAGFKINGSGSKVWMKIAFPNMVDSVYYFNGNTWQFLIASANNYKLFKMKEDQIIFKSSLYPNNLPNSLSNLRVYESQNQTDIYIFGKPLISNATSILVDDTYSGNFQNSYLIGTHNGILKVQSDWSIQNYFSLIDTGNSQLPTNAIYAMASRNNISFSVDTVFLGTDKGILKVILGYDSLVLFQTINTQNSLIPSDSIYVMTFSDEFNFYSDLWVGTHGQGVAKITPSGNITVYDTSNSVLPSNYIKDIRVINNYVCITTDHGFMTIIDSVQQAYTISNSGLLTEDLNTVTIYNHSNNLTPDFLIGTNGHGFAILDANNLWHYYNSQNQNFDCDTVNYFIKTNAFLLNDIIGTSHGLYNLTGAPNNINITPLNILFGENDLVNLRADAKDVLCASFGYRFGSLCKDGIARNQFCAGITPENGAQLSSFKAWVIESQLFITSNLKGKFEMDFIDITGRSVLVRNIFLPVSTAILLPELAEGIYLVRLSDGKQSYSNKLLYAK